MLGPVTGRWIDAFGIFHRGRTTAFGFADGHTGKRSWVSDGLVEWNLTAVDKPESFSFYRVIDNPDEYEDWNWAAKGYPCKSLKGPLKLL